MAVYPLLRTTTPQADPGLAHTTAISNVTELQAMTATGNYYLTGNIDAFITSTWNGGAGFIPIGTSGTKFRATLDGCGYTISNLFINRNSNSQSLLGYVGIDAVVANLTLSGVDITGGGYYCGALAGHIQSSDSGDILIQNCSASGTITSFGIGMGYYGGLIGLITIVGGDTLGTTYVYDSDCSCTMDLVNATTYDYRGGFVGICSRSVISNCFATGSFVNYAPADNGQDIGGFGGNMNYCTVSYCYATGDVNGDTAVGGFVGDLGDSGTVTKSYATGNVYAETIDAGGFAGIVNSGIVGSTVTVWDCYATGDVDCVNVTGGFVGYAPQARDIFGNCYSNGLVSGTTNVGGFDGDSNISTTFTSCYWDITTSGQTTTDGDALGYITKWFRKKLHFVGWDFLTVWVMPDFGKQIVKGKNKSSYLINAPHTAVRNVYI